MSASIKGTYERLLGRPLPEPTDDPNVSILCFVHEESDPSCSVHLETGLWVCYSCGAGGNMVDAVCRVKGISKSEAKTLLKGWGTDFEQYQAYEAPPPPDPIDQEIVNSYVRALIANEDMRAQSLKKFGWSDETLKKYEIGWNDYTSRYTVPVRDEEGLIRNIRMYDPKAQGIDKMISWKKGYGHARLFPIDALDAQVIVLCEGEKDCLLMNQVLRDNKVEGWAAITGTGGAGTWRKGWDEKFKGKDVVVVYDRDPRGIEAAQKVAQQLFKFALRVKIVVLDITEPKNADVTNYFIDSSKGWDDFARLVDATEYFTATTKRVREPKPVDSHVYEPHLAEASQDEFLYKRLKLKAMVAGKDLAPYAVPKKVVFECDMNFGPACKSCIMLTRNGVMESEIPQEDPDLIKMIKVPDDVRNNMLKQKLGVVRRCPLVQLEIEEYHNLEELTLVPEIDFAFEEKEYVSRTAYATKHGVVPNRMYVIEGTSVPHPRTQHVVHFIRKIEHAQDSIDDFAIDDTKLERLAAFQPKDGQSVAEKFQEIADDLTYNITRIYGRQDLVTAADLCFHTVVAFDFQDKPVAKAWGDILIVGDTRTGKSETVQALIQHYKLGELSMGENTSFAGLVGGLKQEAGGRWTITWGKIPLNDRRLLAIDELSGLHTDVIGAMSGIRSNGLAEMVKIQSQKTLARTRLISISNPRADKSMSQYGHGVESVRELIGRPEDIARFDFVISAATNEVPTEVINAAEHPSVSHVFTYDLCRMLLLWTWSRKKDQIEFTPEAVTLCLNLATSQSARYASDGGIPLVEGGNHRIKLAKLAASAAARVFSHDGTGARIVVKPEHVQFVADFLDKTYAKPSLDYAGWSDIILSKTNVPEFMLGQAEDWVKDNPDMAQLWLENPSLRMDDFKTQFDMEAAQVREQVFAKLAKLRMIERGRSSTYHKTPAFTAVIKKVKEAGGMPSDNGTGPTHSDDDIPF